MKAKMKRKPENIALVYIAVLILLLFALLLLASTQDAQAGITIYYCKGAHPWGNSLQDFIVWVERSCSYLPVVLR